MTVVSCVLVHCLKDALSGRRNTSLCVSFCLIILFHDLSINHFQSKQLHFFLITDLRGTMLFVDYLEYFKQGSTFNEKLTFKSSGYQCIIPKNIYSTSMSMLS